MDRNELAPCVCGHTSTSGKHRDDGPCGAYGCPCESYRHLMHARPDRRPAKAVQKYDDEVWIGFPTEGATHTARLAQ